MDIVAVVNYSQGVVKDATLPAPLTGLNLLKWIKAGFI